MAGVGDEDVAGVGGEGVGVSGQVLAEGVEALAPCGGYGQRWIRGIWGGYKGDVV